MIIRYLYEYQAFSCHSERGVLLKESYLELANVDDLVQEFNVSKAIYELGVSTPRMLELVSVNGRAAQPISLTTCAGEPTATHRAGMSVVTTAPAPITAPSPMVTPGRMVTLPPIHTSSQMVTGFAQA